VIRALDPDRGDDQILRAKYLDWCSARIAERFLKLTPEEIYQLAHRASQGGNSLPERRPSETSSPDTPDAAASPAFLQVPTDELDSFQRIVEAVTQVLTTQLQLPSFEDWRASYKAAPDQYEEELLGLWREGL
jgi:hypothetical protein